MSNTLKVKCKATKKVFQNGDFYIYGCSPIYPYPETLKLNQYFSFTVKGDLSWMNEGKEYDIEIEELSTDRYGTSYSVVSCDNFNCENLEDLPREESMEILKEITTERQAKNILNAYPNFIYQILTYGKESIDVSKIYGVGEAYLNAYSRELNTKYKYLNVMNKFKAYKVDINDCKVLSELYHDVNGIEEAITENPYKVLILDLGKSFEKSDKLIMELRPDLKHTELRCSYVIHNVLQRNESQGSTRAKDIDVFYYITEEYPQAKDIEDLIVQTVTTNDLFYYEEPKVVGENGSVSIMSTYLAECQIVDFVQKRIRNNKVLDIDFSQYTKVEDFEMSVKQAKILELACQYAFCILCGFSGSGKTTSLKGVLKMLEENGYSYTLLAPTGKASMRITESVHRPSSTIHRKCLKDLEIVSDFVIVDETSMVDLPTFVMLMNAITNDETRIILCGDNAQLLPVGIGCVFNDLINSGVVPMVMLDEIFRYKTNGGLYVATNVRQGKQFFNDTEMVKHNGNVYSVGNNYKFVQTDDIFKSLVSEYMKLINKGVKPSEILCLSPFNVGEEGTYKINNTIQAEINPPTASNQQYLTRKVDRDKTEITFRLNDRVLNKKNDYQAMPLESYEEILNSNGLLTANDVKVTSVFNGQDGVIRQVEDNYLVVQFGEELVVMDKSKLNNLLLGNCISVHSSQGSEAQYVLNVVSPKHKKMLNRNLLYVADTRAKKLHIDIGDIGTYNDALLVDGNEQRNTWLLDLLKDAFSDNSVE